MREFIKKIIHFKLVQDALSLYSAHIFNVALGFLATVLIVRALPTSEYGEFGFFYTSQMIGSMLVELGIFIALGRMLALASNEEDKKELMGAGLLYVILLAVILSFGILIVGYGVDYLFKVKAGYLFRRWWWITGSVVIHFYLWNIFEGLAEIKKLALFIFLNKITYFLMLLSPIILNQNIHANQVIFAYFFPYLLWGTVFIFWIKPSFIHIKQNIVRIYQDMRAYGFQIFLSNALGFLALKMDQYFVAMFFGPKEMGYYHLASNIAHPLTLFSKSASTSSFRKITQHKELPKNLFIGLMGISLIGSIALLVLVPIFLTPIFSAKFSPILAFFPFVVIHYFLYALRIPFGMYFKAMAKGKLLLRLSLFLIGMIIIFEYGINGHLGLKGPAIGMILANTVILLVLIFYYFRVRGEESQK